MKIVLDTSVLSVCCEIGRLDLLFRLLSSHEIRIPVHVITEILDGYHATSWFYEPFTSKLEIATGTIVPTVNSFEIVACDRRRYTSVLRREPAGAR